MAIENSDKKFPNVLLIVVDCLRADRCPVDISQTKLRFWPDMCREGACFTQTISSATNTPPTFASLLTGQYPCVHGVMTIEGPALADDIPTLATVCKQAGYNTYAHVTGPLIEIFGLDKDFDVYEHRPREKNIYSKWGRSLMSGFAESHAEPWFTLLHLFEVHRPRQLNGTKLPSRKRELKYDLAWEKLDSRLNEFCKQLPENTIIVLTADHGESIRYRADRTWLGYFGRKLRKLFGLAPRRVDWRNHGFFLFEELIRIPFGIRGPGVPANAVIDKQVRQIDIAPTIVDLLGLGGVIETQGRSLVPLMHGRDIPRLPAYIQTGRTDALRCWHGLRLPPYKYVEHPRYGPNLHLCPTLFDLKADQAETKNVAASKPDVALELRGKIDDVLSQGQNDNSSTAGCELSKQEQEKLERVLRANGYL